MVKASQEKGKENKETQENGQLFSKCHGIYPQIK